MNAMNNGARERNAMARRLAVLFDEATLQFALFGLIVAVLVDGALSLGGSTLA